MSEQPTSTKCQYTECALNWLKIVDDWSIGGFKNTFPRMYYVVAGVILLFILF